MDADLSHTPRASSRKTRFRDLEVVRLTEDVRTPEGLFPSGSRGTVVLVYENAGAYEIEFNRPQADVVTLRDDQLTQA